MEILYFFTPLHYLTVLAVVISYISYKILREMYDNLIKYSTLLNIKLVFSNLFGA